MSRGEPRDPAAGQTLPATSNVVPYEVFLRARARLDSESPEPGAVSTPRSGRQGTPGRTGGKARAGAPGIPDAVLSELRKPPDVRPAKVREARRRIRMGFYERPEVLDEIVRRLLEDERQLGDGPSSGGA